MSKISDLLESIKVVPAADDSERNTCCKMKVSDYRKINQVLTLLKQQPPESEFTKTIGKIKNIVHSHTWLENKLLEACDRLDRAEARLKAMYVGDLSPESRLSGYKVIKDELLKRNIELQVHLDKIA